MNELIHELRELIRSARQAAAHSVDIIQVLTNFEIGRRIVEHEQQGRERAEYGKALLKELSAELSAEFGRGFSKRNLEYMRRFYIAYQDRLIVQMPSAQLPTGRNSRMSPASLAHEEFPHAIWQRPSAEFTAPFKLSWSQYVFLISINNPEERSFYEIEAAENSWTLPELKRQFNSGLYERLALSRDKEGVKRLAAEGHLITRPEDLLKEPYVLEFLGLDANIHAKEYRLYLPDKELLRRKLTEWGEEVAK